MILSNIFNTKTLFVLASLSLPFLSNARSLQEQTCAQQTDRLDVVPFDIRVSLLSNAEALQCTADDVHAIHDIFTKALLDTPLSQDLGTVAVHGKVCAPEEEGRRALQYLLNLNSFLNFRSWGTCRMCYPDPDRRLRAQRRAASDALCGCQTLDFQTNPTATLPGSSSTLDTSYTSSHGITVTTSNAGIRFDFVNPLSLDTVHLLKGPEHEDSDITMLITHADLTQSTLSSSESDVTIGSANVLSLAVLGANGVPVVVDKLSYCHGPCQESQSLFHNKLPEMETALTESLNQALTDAGSAIACLSGADATAVVQLADATDAVAADVCM